MFFLNICNDLRPWAKPMASSHGPGGHGPSPWPPAMGPAHGLQPWAKPMSFGHELSPWPSTVGWAQAKEHFLRATF